MEDTLAFLEKEIQAFEKILAELNGKLIHKQLSIEISTNIFGWLVDSKLISLLLIYFLIIVTLLGKLWSYFIF